MATAWEVHGTGEDGDGEEREEACWYQGEHVDNVVLSLVWREILSEIDASPSSDDIQ